MVAVMVLIISSSVAVRDWRTAMQREKEKELIFRAKEITRAIELYQNPIRSGGRGKLPNDLKELVKGGYLRKLYPEPMTARYDDNGELVEGTGQWELIHAGRGGRELKADYSPTSARLRRMQRRSRFGLRQTGPIVGVRSESEIESIGTWEGVKGPYMEWNFIAETPFSRKRVKPGKLPPRIKDLKKNLPGG